MNIPIFQAVALDQQTITKADHRGYTTSFHLRDMSGKGSLGIADLEHQPSASDFFPVRKIRHFEDSQFLDLWERLPDSSPRQGDIGPELEHMDDHDCVPFEKKSYDKPYGYNPHAPLDSEDFFPIHFTYGNKINECTLPVFFICNYRNSHHYGHRFCAAGYNCRILRPKSDNYRGPGYETV